MLFTITFMITCQHDPDFHLDETRVNREVGAAKQWYDANHPRKVSLRSSDNTENSSAVEVKPDWEQAEVKTNKKEKTVETNLYMKGGIQYVMPENKEKFEATGDERYMSSLTRLVVKTKLDNGSVDGFLMTIMPSVEYLEATDFRAFDKNHYIGRDKQFTGRIIYHNLEGEFVNGWVYNKGKITQSIKKSQPDEDPVISMRSSGSYNCHVVEYWGMTVVCTVWYQYTNVDPNPVYMGTVCSDPRYEQIGVGLECSFSGGGDGENGDIDGEDGGYGGGGGGGYNPPPPPIPSTLQQITNTISMTPSQKALLSQALSGLINEGCMQGALYEGLVNRNVKLDFGMKTGTAPSAYDPNTKKITFNDDVNINRSNLKEELFHAFQDAYYAGGIGQYGKDAQGNKLPGYVNVEFEAKVFKDIIMETGGSSAFFKYETPEEIAIYRDYSAWIESVKDDMSILQDQNEYSYWLDLFNEHNPDYSSSRNDFSSFHGLYDLINGSECF